MTTVIFIHGTGVRGREYEETFKTIEQKIHAQRPDVKVERCLWGDKLGTSLLASGASIPRYDQTLALEEEEEEDKEILRWNQLYHNPLYELRLLSLKPGENRYDNPFTALRARQKAGGRGQKVDVTVYTRMECLLPCLAHNGSKPTDLFVTKNKICCETRSARNRTSLFESHVFKRGFLQHSCPLPSAFSKKVH